MGGVVGPLLLMLGLSHATASGSALLLNTEGLATMAIAWIVFCENVDQRLIFGAFAILAGAVLLSWNGDGGLFRPRLIAAMLKGLIAGAANIGLAVLAGSPFHNRITVATAGSGCLGSAQSRDVHSGATRKPSSPSACRAAASRSSRHAAWHAA